MRNFVEEVPDDPSKFLKDSNAPKIAHEDSDEMLLSFNFGKQFESGKILNRNDINFNPVLQVTNASTMLWKLALNSTECAQK